MLDKFALKFVGVGKHTAHCGDKETSRPAAWVENGIVGLEVDEFAKKFGDVSRGEHDAETLPVAAAVADEFAVEPAEIIFRRVVDDGVINFVRDKLREKFQRRLAERAVYGVEYRAVLNQAKLTQDALLLDFGADVGAAQVDFDLVEKFCAVGVEGVARESVDAEIFPFGKRKQNR